MSNAERLETALDFYKKKCVFSGVPSISAVELKDRLDRGEQILIVDCRSAEEQSVSKIPGAIGLQDLESDAFSFSSFFPKTPAKTSSPSVKEDDNEDKETKISSFLPGIAVCHCTGGFRSGEFISAGGLKKIQKRFPSVKRAFNLEASLVAWAHAGGSFEVPATGEVTKRVHTWGSNFYGYFPTDYETVQEPAPSGAGRLRCLMCLDQCFEGLKSVLCCCCSSRRKGVSSSRTDSGGQEKKGLLGSDGTDAV